MSDCCEEKVRIPGIINMEHEDTAGVTGTGGSDPSCDNNDNADTEVKNLKLNIPLAPLNVEVGDSSFLSRILSCSKFNTRYSRDITITGLAFSPPHPPRLEYRYQRKWLCQCTLCNQ